MRTNWREIRWKSTAANYLTVFRLLLVPLFAWLFLTEHYVLQLIATFLFIIAAITDAIDGHLARKRNEVTQFGAFLDPFADKLLTLTAFVLIALRKEFSLLLVNMVVYISLIAAREIGITMLRIWAIDRGQPLVTSLWGKMKTGIQLTTLIGTLLYFNLRDWMRAHGIKIAYLDDQTVVPVLHFLIVICVIVTIISGWLYLRNLSFRKKQ
ncbi:MAG: CDP-diacylglycerol--glycerol-3-phosphate 3-phosphatidyltransferase [bacterium]|nr:CDP-diacylglycerol--glycerol-3-phosphate 3-phosphatidyltransferase [bacterium]